MDAKTQPEARCPEHQGPALATCVRCGRFMCEACGRDVGDIYRCEACRATPKTAALAIWGFVLALIPCACIFLVGGILSTIAYVRIRERPRELGGRSLALAGMIIAGVWLGLSGLGMVTSIAIPNYIQFQARSKQSEAKAVLKSALTAQRSYAKEHGAWAQRWEDLGVTVEPGYRYTYYLDNGAPLYADRGLTPLPQDFEGALDGRGTTILAVANIDTDPALDVWSIDVNGALVNHVNDVVVETDPVPQY